LILGAALQMQTILSVALQMYLETWCGSPDANYPG